VRVVSQSPSHLTPRFSEEDENAVMISQPF
jgi:hypothetical protein